MNIARILYPIRVLGPGERLGIWTAGCPRRCSGCSNPELWNEKEDYEITITRLIEIIRKSLFDKNIDGIVISGGDPFYQPDELLKLLKELSIITQDILVYTGYTYTELLNRNNDVINECLDYIGVLIDGPYIEEKNDGSRLKGSNNQNIIVLNQELQKKYAEYLSYGVNEIQNFRTSDGIVSVGIHQIGFKDSLIKKAKEQGVVIDG